MFQVPTYRTLLRLNLDQFFASDVYIVVFQYNSIMSLIVFYKRSATLKDENSTSQNKHLINPLKDSFTMMSWRIGPEVPGRPMFRDWSLPPADLPAATQMKLTNPIYHNQQLEASFGSTNHLCDFFFLSVTSMAYCVSVLLPYFFNLIPANFGVKSEYV